MATRTSSLAPTNVSDASFRLWINEIHNSLIAFGWVQTSDTGQINFSTVLRPAAINTYQGYAVYRMADSLQSTCAVFMRLDFGTGGGTDSPALKVKVGIGSTDGAGTLTGNLSTQVLMVSGSAPSAALFNCRTAGTTSSFRMHFWGTTYSNVGLTVAIERDLDTSGAETSLGVNILTSYQSAGGTCVHSSQFLELAGGTGPVEVRWYAMISAQTSQSGGGNVGVGPVRCTLGPFRNPMKTVLVYAVADFVIESTNPVTIYGASHTYLMLKPNFGSSISLNTWNTACGFALLWE